MNKVQAKKYLDQAFSYAQKFSTCRKVYVGAVFVTANGDEVYSCNRTDSPEKNCQMIGECYKAKVTGIYESCEETRKYCSAVHSEINMIQILKDNNVNIDGGTLYVTRYPCHNCARNIVDFGIKNVVYGGRQKIDEEVEELFKRSNVSVTWYADIDYENDRNKIWWTRRLCDYAYDEIKDRKFPITIPSYNRFSPNILNGMLKDMDENYNYPIFIFVRESQKEDYLKNINHPYVSIVSFKDELIDNAGAARRMIMKWAYTNGYDNIFSFDDDLLNIQVTEKGYTGKGDLKSKVISDMNICKVLASWQLAMEHAENLYDVVLSGAMPMGFSWKMEYCFKSHSMLMYRGNLNQAVCINVKKLFDAGIVYKDNKDIGHEDIQLVAEINHKNQMRISHDLAVCTFPFLAYSVPPMTCENFGNFGSNMKDRFRNQQAIMLSNWHDTPWINFREKRDLCQVVINWRRYRKDIGVNQYVYDIFEGDDFNI